MLVDSTSRLGWVVNSILAELADVVFSALVDFSILAVLLAMNMYQIVYVPSFTRLCAMGGIFWLLLVAGNSLHFWFYVRYKRMQLHKRHNISLKRAVHCYATADLWFAIRAVFYAAVNQVGIFHLTQLVWTDSSEVWYTSSMDLSHEFPSTFDPCGNLFYFFYTTVKNFTIASHPRAILRRLSK